MELPVTSKGNKYVIVFQDLFTKWPMVYPEEIVPCFGVPEAILSDKGTTLF